MKEENKRKKVQLLQHRHFDTRLPSSTCVHHGGSSTIWSDKSLQVFGNLRCTKSFDLPTKLASLFQRAYSESMSVQCYRFKVFFERDFSTERGNTRRNFRKSDRRWQCFLLPRGWQWFAGETSLSARRRLQIREANQAARYTSDEASAGKMF